MSSTPISTTTFDFPPSPDDAWEIQRWDHTRLRRRMLTGEWAPDLRSYLRRALGEDEADEINGLVDISGNLFASVCSTLSTLYTVPPKITHADEEATRRMTAILDGAGFASTMGSLQRMTLGLRQCLLYVSVIPTNDLASPVEVALRPVYPDLVTAKPHPHKPWEPVAIREAVQTVDESGRIVWSWFDSAIDPSEPRAVLPYQMYHAEYGSVLWDCHAWSELVEGTLSAATNRSSANHNLRFAAYSARYIVDASLASEEDSKGKHKVVASRSTVLQLKTEDGKQAQVGQWEQPYSPSEFSDAIERSENTMAVLSGIPAADVLRTTSDSRSGVSLQISKEGQRTSARRFESTFRRGDLGLLRRIAILVNDELGTEYLPESGWSIEYQSEPPTQDEVRAEQDRILAQLERGLKSEVEARAAISGESLAEAKAALDQIREERMRGSVALTVGAQTTIVDVLARVQAGALTPATARPILISVLGMAPESADVALAGVGPVIAKASGSE